MTSRRWLIIVDAQNDFVAPNGTLPAPEGEKTAQKIAQYLEKRPSEFDLIVKSRDWHPPSHVSFTNYLKPNQHSIWPPHAIQRTPGAAFHSAIPEFQLELIVSKGVTEQADSKSAFGDRSDMSKKDLVAEYRASGKWVPPPADQEDTGLAKLAIESPNVEVWVVGFVTEVCVKATVLDALALGLKTYVVGDCCGGLSPEGHKAALDEMQAQGACIV
eukprot:Protomagalhaensia_wolfi_Nauph_80__3122@NODE_318_length_2797_cov_12_520667_g240_i0_p3_GENE_NODE_318_length_2797_cov_12_520667_g240_i0NODE_318_length_2797_cov_12_520667_g240_i0_p3_ORF_typecomplete_len216_score32_41Isochorismatase/PF00857_20/5_7e37_NODE_318_length_2797_cov_12_520667_g240_i034681